MFTMFGSNAVWQIPSKNGAIFCNEDRAFFSAETPGLMFGISSQLTIARHYRRHHDPIHCWIAQEIVPWKVHKRLIAAYIHCRHRQWPMSITALLNRLSLLIRTTRKSAIAHLAAAVKAYPDWRPMCFSKGAGKVVIAPPPPIQFLDIGQRSDCMRLRDPSRIRKKGPMCPSFRCLAHSMGWCMRSLERLGQEIRCGVIQMLGPNTRHLMISMSLILLGTPGDYRLLFPLVLGSCLNKVPRRSMWTLPQTHCMPRQVIWSRGTL